MVVVSLVVKPLVYYLFGLYRRLWTYASTKELMLIVFAVTVASVGVSAVMIILLLTNIVRGIPRTVLAIDWLLSLIGVGGFRFMLRIIAESRIASTLANRKDKPRQALIIGAGDAGALVVREMQKNPQLNLIPVGFLDDDDAKQKHQIYGVSVIGKLSDLPRALDYRRIDEVIIAIPSAGGRVVRMVTDLCRIKGVQFRTMPGLYELIGGKVSASRLREVDITDLLRREPARLDTHLIGAALSKKRVLVTGAGGSIGRELCRQIARWGPGELYLLGHGENSIFETLIELREDFPSLSMHPIIADTRDLSRIQAIFSSQHPQVVFHAAAHKHVPLMEVNVEDAVTNNIIGTGNIMEAVGQTDLERFVMISTDKAIRPVNVMGATKRLAEMLVLDAARKTKNPYSVVRFGNVLGSRGSVVPLFKSQIAHGGPVTVTHPDMKRYFMTIPEAVHLVLQAAAMGAGGEVFLLNMGQQIRILDLAEDLIRLSGLEPSKDIDIVFTGIRAGEKLSEDLWEEGTQYKTTQHPDIYQVTNEDLPSSRILHQTIDQLIQLAEKSQTSSIIDLLDKSIPSAAIRATPPPDMTSIV
jgi:FlaA1/EpsC-like NDP-sugar epimerase